MKPHLTIIDDDQGFVELLREIAEDAGFKVQTYTYAAFVNVLEQDLPTVILLDVWFNSWQSGLDLAKALKHNISLEHVPVVLMSSDIDVGKYSEEVGADSYLAKPFDMDQLIDTLQTVIN